MPLKTKMKVIEDVSQAMEDHADLNQHISGYVIRRDTLQSIIIIEGCRYVRLTID